MAHGKSGRSKRTNPLAAIIGIVFLLIVFFIGIIFEEISNETVATVVHEAKQSTHDMTVTTEEVTFYCKPGEYLSEDELEEGDVQW